MIDRELAPIGAAFLREYTAWQKRNEARAGFRAFRNIYWAETGEWFDPENCEPEELELFKVFEANKNSSQKALNQARRVTRRIAAALAQKA